MSATTVIVQAVVAALALALATPATAFCHTVDPDPLTGESGKVYRWGWAIPYHWAAQGQTPPGPVEIIVESFGGRVTWTIDLTEFGYVDHPLPKGTNLVLTLGDGSKVDLPLDREVPARLFNRDNSTMTVWRVTLDVPFDVARRLADDPPLGLQADLGHGSFHGVFRPAPGRRVRTAFSCVLDR